MRPISLAPLAGDSVDQAPARGAQVQQHHPAIDDVAPASDEALAHETVTHAGGGRRIDSEGLGQIDRSLRTPGPEDHEGPVLGQRDLRLVLSQGPGGHGHEDPAGGEDGVGQLVGLSFRSVPGAGSGSHTVIVAIQCS